jgi:hypothetical protein
MGQKKLENFHLEMIKVVCIDHHFNASNNAGSNKIQAFNELCLIKLLN